MNFNKYFDYNVFKTIECARLKAVNISILIIIVEIAVT